MKGEYIEYGGSAGHIPYGDHSSSSSPTLLGPISLGSISLSPSQPVLAEYVWLDGELVPVENAKVIFLNPSHQNASAIFEGFHCYNTPRGPAVFRLAEHLELFLDRIRLLGVDDFRHDVEELCDIVCRVVQVNRFAECYIRPALYFESAIGSDLTAHEPVLGVAAWKLDHQISEEALEVGIRLVVSSVTRNRPEANQTETTAEGGEFDDAVMVDPDGYVTEATGGNLLLVRNNTIFATPLIRILEGLTRNAAMALAQDAGYTVAETPLSWEQLYISDEVFVCGTAAELLPVREIDSHPIGSGRAGPVTRKLQNLFEETINGQNRRSAEWLDYMVLEPVI